jgi:Arc/MetJ-type ribon-helix-helix transcriptional regulator
MAYCPSNFYRKKFTLSQRGKARVTGYNCPQISREADIEMVKKRVKTHSHSLLPEQQQFVRLVAQQQGLSYSEVIRLAVQTLAQSTPAYQALLAQATDDPSAATDSPMEQVRSAAVRQPISHRLTLILYGEQWELSNASRALRYLVEQVRPHLPEQAEGVKAPTWASLDQEGGGWTFAYTITEDDWALLTWLGHNNRSRGIRKALQQAVKDNKDWHKAWQEAVALGERITAVSEELTAGSAQQRAEWGLDNPAPHKVLAVWQDDHVRFAELYTAVVGN